MATLNITIPDEIFAELTDIAEQLKQTPEQCLHLAMCHFLQTRALDTVLEGMARSHHESSEHIDFPELKETYGIDIKFHPMAIEELESLTEEEQMGILEEIIERISEDDPEAEATIDLVIQEQGETQIVLSEFDFGDVVYQISSGITVYHIALNEELLEDEELEEDESVEA